MTEKFLMTEKQIRACWQGYEHHGTIAHSQQYKALEAILGKTGAAAVASTWGDTAQHYANPEKWKVRANRDLDIFRRWFGVVAIYYGEAHRWVQLAAIRRQLVQRVKKYGPLVDWTLEYENPATLLHLLHRHDREHPDRGWMVEWVNEF